MTGINTDKPSKGLLFDENQPRRGRFRVPGYYRIGQVLLPTIVAGILSYNTLGFPNLILVQQTRCSDPIGEIMGH
jgi:hypothetical protein